MNQTNLLVVSLCENSFEETNLREKIVADGVSIMNIICVNPAQVNMVNEMLRNGRIADILIICGNHFMEAAYINKLLEILYSCERHGAVVSLNMHSQGLFHLTKEKYEKVSKYLSDYRVIPQIESFPVLIRGEMFERFGLLDESFNSIAGALADFSLRFNQYGWSTVRANCWNDSEVLFETLLKSDMDSIQKRYPYIRKIEEIYYVCEEKATEHFADVLVSEQFQKPSLLFSLYEVPPAYNGTANYTLKLLEAFWGNYCETYEISILVKKSTDEFYKLSEKYPNVYYPETVRQHTFRLGYITSQVFSAEHMDIINRCCLKYSICMLDIICLRSHYLCKNDPNRFDLFRDSIEFADIMLSISRFSHDDIVSFFHDEITNAHIRTGFVYLGTDKEISDIKPDSISGPFNVGDYFIVIGNPYKHKMIDPVLEILKDIEENFIIVGTKTEGYYHKSKRIYGYVSGWLDSDSLDRMIAGSKGILFPSVYEGFGLTLYDAAVYQKKIIVSDTQVNFELKHQLGDYGAQIITYRKLKELKNILSEDFLQNHEEKKIVRIRNWKEVVTELEAWIEIMQKEETDIIRLERRWNYLKRYQNIYNSSAQKKANEKKEKIIRRCISCFPRTYKLYRKLVTAIDREHYGSC